MKRQGQLAAARRQRPAAPEPGRRRDAASASSSALPFVVLAAGYAALLGYGLSMRAFR